MLPITPALPSEIADAAKALAGVAAVAGGGLQWWQFHRKWSPAHKQARVLYFEVVYNLLLARHGQRSHPPLLLLSRAEWSRPNTLDVLAKVLDEKQIVHVAGAYLQLATYERLFRLPWTELLAIRVTGVDVGALRTVGDQFAAAELVLRGRLYSRKGQAALARAIGDDLSRLAVPDQVTPGDRLSNTLGSVPMDLTLGVLLALGTWRVWALASWVSRRGRGRRPHRTD
jgi:hypothetical protein